MSRLFEELRRVEQEKGAKTLGESPKGPSGGNQNNSEPPSVVGRRSTRLSVIIPITIQGIDTTGQPFKENTWTIGVNKQGAKIATFHLLPEGGHITITNPVLGRTAKAHVMWVGEKRYKEDPYEVGIELLEAVNVWGIQFPPEDWKRSARVAPAPRDEQKVVQPAPPEQAVKTVPPQAPKAPEFSRPAGPPAAVPAEAPAHPEKFSQFNLAVSALSRYSQQAGGTVEVRPEPLGKDLDKLAFEVDSQIQAGLREVANRLKELAEREKSARSVGGQLSGLLEMVQSSRDQTEAQVARVQELHRGWQAEVEKARHEIQGAGRQALESVTQELVQRLRKEMETASSTLAEETLKHIQGRISPPEDRLIPDTGTRLASLTEDFIAKAAPQLEEQQNRAVEQAKGQLALVVQGAAEDLTGKLRNVAEEMKAALREEVEKSLEKSAGQLLGRLTQSFEGQAQTTSQTIERSFQDRLQKIQAQLDEEISGAGLKVRQTCEQEAERAGKLVAERADSLNLAAEAASTKLQTASHNIKAALEAETDAHPQKLTEMMATALEGFQRQMDGLISGYQAELQETTRKCQEKGVREVSEQIQKTSEDLLESSTRELQKQTGDALEMLTEELKSSGSQVAGETQQQLLAMSQSTRDALTQEAQAAEQALKGLSEELRTSGKALVAECENQLSTAAGATLESVTKEAQSSEQNLKTLNERFTASSKALVDEAEKQLRNTSRVTLESFSEEACTTEQLIKNLSGEVKASGKAAVEETEKQLRTTTQVTLGSLTDQARAIAEEGRNQLQRTLQEFQEKGPQELEAQLLKTGEKTLTAILNQLQKEAYDSNERAMAGIKGAAEQVVKEATDAVYKQVGVGAVVLKDWADQSRNQLEAYFLKSVEASQKQITDLWKTSLESQRREAESLLDELHARLQQASRVFQKGPEAREIKDQDAFGKPSDPSSPHLRKKTDEYLDLVIEQLKEKTQHAVNEETQAFRKKLADALAAYQPGTKKPGDPNP